MSRTYGEVLERSFPDVFKFARGSNTAFVDIGSGYGEITFDSVRVYGCHFGLGIEKFREPAAICAKRFAKLPAEVQQRLKFILEDINDTDLVEELANVQYTTLLMFCNNLAFNQGTVNRLARKTQMLMDKLADKFVILISTVPLPSLQDRFSQSVLLRMSWSEELHESCVYASRPISSSPADTQEGSKGDLSISSVIMESL